MTEPGHRRLLGDPADDRAGAPATDDAARSPLRGRIPGPVEAVLGTGRRRIVLLVVLGLAVALVVGLALSRGGRDRLVGPLGAAPTPVTGSTGAQLASVAGDVVIVGPLALRPEGARLDALRVQDGTSYWTYARTGATVRAVTRVDPRHAAVLWSDARVDVVDTLGPRVVWSADTTELPPVDSTGGRLSLRAAGPEDRRVVVLELAAGVTAYDGADGGIRWQRPAPEILLGAGDGVVALSHDLGRTVELVDPTSGHARRTWTPPAQVGGVAVAGQTAVSWAGERVFAAGGGGATWTVTTDSPRATLAAAGELVAVDTPGRLQVLAAADGSRLAAAALPIGSEETVGRPAVVSGTAWVATDDTLTALARDGAKTTVHLPAPADSLAGADHVLAAHLADGHTQLIVSR